MGLTLGVDATFLPRDHRGMGRYVRQVLAAWRGGPHRLVLLTRRDLPALRAEMPGWECRAVADSPPLDACWFPWNRVDWEPPCPRVVTIHDVAAFGGPGFPPDPAGVRRLRQAVARADCVLTVSRFSRDEIARRLGREALVAPNGVGPPFAPGPRRAGFRPRPFLLYVGNQDPRKNLQGLLEAFARLAPELPHDLCLTMPRPARPGLLDRLLGRARPLYERLGERLVWLGQTGDEELADLYRHCDLFVMPSLYEGFGIPLLEALACGAPVAAARTSSLPEVGGDLPWWFDPSDPADIARAVQAALQAPPRPEGPARAARFRWQDTARIILEILESHARRALPLPTP